MFQRLNESIVVVQDHPFNSRGSTAAPYHQYTAHPSLDTSPRVAQSLPDPLLTTLRLRPASFPKCALCFCGACTVNDDQENKETGRGSGSYTHEDPGSGTMWSPRAPTQAMLSCATVMPLRFAMVVRGSISLRLSLIFFDQRSWVCQLETVS